MDGGSIDIPDDEEEVVAATSATLTSATAGVEPDAAQLSQLNISK
jgi:hypothetical protein